MGRLDFINATHNQRSNNKSFFYLKDQVSVMLINGNKNFYL